jgi:hypothetical protein
MKKLNKKILTITLAATFFYLVNFNVAGAVNLPFGGLNVIPPIPCSCSGGIVWYAWLTPLHIGGLPIKTGPVSIGIPPTAIWYSTYTPVTLGAWDLGRMIIGTETCWTLGYPSCYIVPTIGHVYMTGSSTGLPI